MITVTLVLGIFTSVLASGVPCQTFVERPGFHSVRSSGWPNGLFWAFDASLVRVTFANGTLRVLRYIEGEETEVLSADPDLPRRSKLAAIAEGPNGHLLQLFTSPDGESIVDLDLKSGQLSVFYTGEIDNPAWTITWVPWAKAALVHGTFHAVLVTKDGSRVVVGPEAAHGLSCCELFGSSVSNTEIAFSVDYGLRSYAEQQERSLRGRTGPSSIGSITYVAWVPDRWLALESSFDGKTSRILAFLANPPAGFANEPEILFEVIDDCRWRLDNYRGFAVFWAFEAPMIVWTDGTRLEEIQLPAGGEPGKVVSGSAGSSFVVVSPGGYSRIKLDSAPARSDDSEVR